MAIDPTLEKVLLMLAAAAVGYAFSRIGKSRDNKSAEVLRKEAAAIEAVVERDKAIGILQREVAVMRAEAVPITAAFMASLQAKVKHFHTPDLDKMVGRMKPDVALSPAETAKLKTALAAEAKVVDPLIDEEERIAKRILLDVQRMAVIESEKRATGETRKLETLLVSQPAQSDGEEEEKKDREEEKRN